MFCDLVEGTRERVVVCEDEMFIAFMDNCPINRGHLLVAPKKHYEDVLDMPLREVGELFIKAAEIAKAVIKAVNADGFNIGLNNGMAASQTVPHVHVHIIPRYVNDAPNGWPSRRSASIEELEQVAELIRQRVESKPS